MNMVDEAFKAGAIEIPEMPRFGMIMSLGREFDNFTYYGRGPWENYADRNNASLIGIYSSKVAEQYVPYTRPQENGYKTDLRWLTLTNDEGKGIRIEGLQSICASALHNRPMDFDEGLRKINRHASDITPRKEVILCVDLAQRGVGGDNSWGALPLPQYRLKAEPRRYRFALRPEAKFHDGTPLTAHDVAFSLNVLKEKGHPIVAQNLRDFKGAEAADERIVVARFAENRGRDVPLFVAGLPIFSRAYYAKQPFDQSTLEAPLGSGPYKVGRFEPGRFIEFDRVKDWWGADLPVARGLFNFDTIRYEYYRDREVGFEGFTAKNYLFREEFTSRTWATRYNFPAFTDGRVLINGNSQQDVYLDRIPFQADFTLLATPGAARDDGVFKFVSDMNADQGIEIERMNGMLAAKQ